MSDRWRSWRDRVDLDEYDSRWDRLAANGADVHGEADFLVRLVAGSLYGIASRAGIAAGDSARVVGSGSESCPSVLDAGCGTGRLGVELARRGWSVVGVDNDADMVARAAAKAARAEWALADLASVRLDRHFDVVAMAGNVMLFVEPGREPLVVANLADHLAPGGWLVSGHSLDDPDHLDRYDGWCGEAGLEPAGRFASWDGAPFNPPGGYAVSVHVRPA